MGKLSFYKCTGPNGIAHYDRATRYEVGREVKIEDPSPAEAGPCGRGLHVSPRLVDTARFARVDLRQCEFFLVEVDPADVIASDAVKSRVRSLHVAQRVQERDVGIVRGRLDEVLGSGSGYGSGDGYGYGYGYGSGSGDGYGYGYGYGYGSGDGDGSGYGYGSGAP